MWIAGDHFGDASSNKVMLRRIKLDKLDLIGERKESGFCTRHNAKSTSLKQDFNSIPLLHSFSFKLFQPGRAPTRRELEVEAAQTQRNRRLGRSRNRARNGTLGRICRGRSRSFVGHSKMEEERARETGAAAGTRLWEGTLARIIWRQSHFSHVKYGGFRKIPWRRTCDGIGPRMRLSAASPRSLPHGAPSLGERRDYTLLPRVARKALFSAF